MKKSNSPFQVAVVPKLFSRIAAKVALMFHKSVGYYVSIPHRHTFFINSITMPVNHAVVLDNIKDMKLKEYPMPKMGSDDCVIEMKSIGICGSDVHYWQHGRIGDFVCNGPMVLGHESAGIVAAVGSGVSNLRVGDRVALEPGVPCENCEQCKSGKYNLCPDIAFFATPPIHGSLARYVAHPAKWCFKLPANMTLEEGALCEPLSVGVYACKEKAKVRNGDTVAVFGAGPIGTICSLVANGLYFLMLILSSIIIKKKGTTK